MKSTRINKLARLAIATFAFAAGAGTVIAGQNSTSKEGVARVIQLPEPNNATQTVTIWIPETKSGKEADTAKTKERTSSLL